MLPSPSAASDPLWRGIDQFNAGEYYACHDTLEAIWMVAAIPEKPFFQGILQIAVALHHLGNHNWRGAMILLGEGMRRLEPFEPSYREVPVSDFLDRVDQWLHALQQSGPEQVAAIAARLESSQQSPVATDDSPPLPSLTITRQRQDEDAPA